MLILMLAGFYAQAQQIQTVFKSGRSGGYGAISNKFTKIGDEYANMVEVYGGWYTNGRFLLGLGASAATNNIPVLPEHSVSPWKDMSYAYGQFGMVNEYVLGSDKALHAVFHLFTGAGFTAQYDRYGWDGDDEDFDDMFDTGVDENWFFVLEPGVQLELNVVKWMRFSPGVSYRLAYGSDAAGLSDNDLSNISYNLTLKFGKF